MTGALIKVPNAMNIELSHPSVRIKGTESDFVPVTCVDPRCKHHPSVHMHCPFCVKTQIFYDDRILKVHYCVKHVDKGIEFAGLRILRCCETCEIVGVIKGEKKFKGAHWHCYKCRNGFNRRDEALKHYKTHFKQPYSTFQIHIAQDVNTVTGYQEYRVDGLEAMPDNIQDFVARNSTSEPNPQKKRLGTTVILKQGEGGSIFGEDGLDVTSDLSSSDLMVENASSEQLEDQTDIIIIQDNRDNSNTFEEPEGTLLEQKLHLEKLVKLLREQILEISQNKDMMERKLKAEIRHLQEEVQRQAKELERLGFKEQEKELNEAEDSSESCSKLQRLVVSLQKQHSQLLTDHIQQVHKEAYIMALQEIKDMPFNSNSKKQSTEDKKCTGVSVQSVEGNKDRRVSAASTERIPRTHTLKLSRKDFRMATPFVLPSMQSSLFNSVTSSVQDSETQNSTYLIEGSLFGESASKSSPLSEGGGELESEPQRFSSSRENSSLTSFITESENAGCATVVTTEESPTFSRSYFVVAQSSTGVTKRKYEDMLNDEHFLNGVK